MAKLGTSLDSHSTAVVAAIPVYETTDANLDGCCRLVVKLFDEIANVGVGVRYIAGLERQEFLDRRLAQSLFQRGDVIHEFHRLVVADVVNAPGRRAGAGIGDGAVPVGVGRRRPVENADYALDDVVDIGEVAPVLAVVEDLYRLTGQDGLGKLEEGHVRPSPGPIDGEETQAGCR